MTEQAPIKVPTAGEGQTLTPFEKQTKDSLEKHELLIYSILAIVAITLIGIAVATVTLYIDQAHFNYATYQTQAGEFQQQLDQLKYGHR